MSLGPRVLLVGGLDPSGRAGLLADVQTVLAAGAVPCAVVTALTAQGSRAFSVTPVAPSVVRRQLEAVLDTGPVQAVKLGMVPTRPSLEALWSGLRHVRAPRVVDPVVRTSRGQRLSRLRREDYLGLAGPRVLLTPNLAELRWLAGWRALPGSVEERVSAAQTLLDLGFGAVVVKGGHLAGAPTDLLVRAGAVARFPGARLPRSSRHRGTGCRFGSGVAVALASGAELTDAVNAARAGVRRYLRGA